MTKAPTGPVLKLIRRMAEDHRLKQLTDSELLRRFSSEGDEAAFHSLVHRHGALVLDVCRNVLRNEADAEDAFQATFLILAKKAGSIRNQGSVASWLYGVIVDAKFGWDLRQRLVVSRPGLGRVCLKRA